MNLRAQLEYLEGRKRSAYPDNRGYWTIAVGRLIDSRLGGGLSEAEIDLLLTNDIAEKTAQVRTALPWFDNLNEPRQAVLIGMCFQMGLGSAEEGKGLLGFQATLAAARDGHFEHAKTLMLQSRWATQTPVRAKLMAEQLASGEWQFGG